jgi:hypothetical protein
MVQFELDQVVLDRPGWNQKPAAFGLPPNTAAVVVRRSASSLKAPEVDLVEQPWDTSMY